MKILLAPDKFKGSLSAKEVCTALAEGILSIRADAEITMLPMADGGEGSLEIIALASDAKRVSMFVKDPLFRTIKATYLRKGDIAYIEMAAASGLSLINENQRNPEFTNTYGTGQLVKHAVKNGAKEVNLFIGGSATNDGGIGMAQALGYQFKDENEEDVLSIGMHLSEIRQIIPPENGLEFKMNVLCDVENPLYGENGAAFVFAAQKGADKDMIIRLDAGLQNLSDIIKKDLGKDIANIPGAGAAGGLGAGALAFCNASILPGIQSIMEITQINNKLKGADLIITGEGKMDSQTLSGKVVAGIAAKAKSIGVDCLAVCGLNELEEKEWHEMGLSNVYPLVNEKISKLEAMENTHKILQKVGKQIALDIS